MVSRAGERHNAGHLDTIPSRTNRTCKKAVRVSRRKGTQPPSRTGTETAASRTERTSRPQRTTIWNCRKFGKCVILTYYAFVDTLKILIHQKRKPKRATAFLFAPNKATGTPTNGKSHTATQTATARRKTAHSQSHRKRFPS